MKRVAFVGWVTVCCVIGSTTTASAFVRSGIPALFSTTSQSASLAVPSMILIDSTTGEVVFEKDSNSLRKPASVQKLFSATAALEYMDPAYVFETKVFLGNQANTIVITGDFDPWMTSKYKDALSQHRVWVNYIANKAVAELKSHSSKTLRSMTIEYNGVYSQDILAIHKYLLSKGIKSKEKPLASDDIASIERTEIASVSSPSVAEMIKFALLWSDNLLAERLARAAAHKAGFAMDDAGVSNVFHEVAKKFVLDDSGLFVHDGSGLSKENRVTAKLVAELLMKVHNVPKFALLYEGLPVSGVSGTLENRFIKTVPEAVGLIHAKTGTLDGTISLAGYIDAADRQYVFVIIADRIPKGYIATNRARTIVDTLVGKISSPLTTPSSTQPTQDPSAITTPEAAPDPTPSP